ncbi:hypothetical protein [Mesorhizobium retamae]|uniref:RES domain-containing protein n=1 Tax=Mesorhizobium retamae TaxID=2912854 RepID=A0ABS9QJW4_9HYPH|nr:hypothetical protein [Mesorhizobium sp. IRAMC:0171]MCG7507630.1 hypothetical protein [Mesorhizobium sp. IRAMC:0171]
MKTYPGGSNIPVKASRLGADIPLGINLNIWHLRTEAQYDLSENPPELPSRIVDGLSRLSGLSQFVFYCNHSVEARSAFRKRKGILGGTGLPVAATIQGESVFDGDKSRLWATIAVESFVKEGLFMIAQNYLQSCIVLSRSTLADIAIRAQGWAADASGLFSIDYRKVLDTMSNDRDFMLVRYFTADNGHDEKIMVIARDDLEIDPIDDLIKREMLNA